MNKDKVIYGVFGMIVGLVVGFVFANSVNNTVASKDSASAAATNAVPGGANPALPPDHPPLGTTSAATSSSQGAPMPEISTAIEKARTEPKNFEAQMTAADLYYQIGRFEDAAAFYEAANKLKPTDVEPIIKLGNSYFDSEKYLDAEKWYTMALQKEPKNINVRTDLGLTFFLREPRDIARAVKEYEASLAIDPDHEITLQNLVLAYKEDGDTVNFDRSFERLRKINPNNPVILKTPDRQP